MKAGHRTNPLLQCEWDLFNFQRLQCKKNCTSCNLAEPCETLYPKIKGLLPDEIRSRYITDSEWKVFCKYLDACCDVHGTCDECKQRVICDKLFAHIEPLCRCYYKELNRIAGFDKGNPCVSDHELSISGLIRPLSFTDCKGLSFMGTGEWRK